MAHQIPRRFGLSESVERSDMLHLEADDIAAVPAEFHADEVDRLTQR